METLTIAQQTPSPILPAGYHLFAWGGVVLAVPREWNLCRYQGGASRGGLVFADLRSLRIFVRWRPLKRFIFSPPPEKPLEASIRRLRRRFPAAEFHSISKSACALSINRERFVLAADHERRYELFWPASDSIPARAIAEDPLAAHFLFAIEHPSPGYWNLYGARTTFNPAARLKQVSLNAGAPRLLLTHKRSVRMAGAFSLADRLLEQGNLHHIGEKYLHLAGLPGQWHGQSASERFTGRISPKWPFKTPIDFQFSLEHDATENRISWELATTRPFLRIWKP